MAETLYLTPAGTPSLSPAQAPRKRKVVLDKPNAADDTAAEPKKPTAARTLKTKQTKSRNGKLQPRRVNHQSPRGGLE